MDKQQKGFTLSLSAERKAVVFGLAGNVKAAFAELWASLNTDVQAALDSAKLPRNKKACEGLVTVLRKFCEGLADDAQNASTNARLEADKLRAELAGLLSKSKLSKSQQARIGQLPGLIEAAESQADKMADVKIGLESGLSRYPMAIAMAYFWCQALPVTDTMRNIKGLAGFDETVSEAERAEAFNRAKAGAKVGAAAKGNSAEETKRQIQNIASASNKLVQARALLAAGIEGLRSEGFTELAAQLIDVVTDFIPSFNTAERAGAENPEQLKQLVAECEKLQAEKKAANNALL